MKVLHFNSKEARDARNVQGLPLGPEDVTRRLFDEIREKGGARRYALLIPANDEDKLTGQEQAALHNPFVKEDYERG